MDSFSGKDNNSTSDSSPTDQSAGQDLGHLKAHSSVDDLSDCPKAKFGIRFVAMLLDILFSASLSSLLLVIIGFTFGKEVITQEGVFSPLFGFGFWLAYWCAPLYNNGQTLGKRIVGLVVVNSVGTPELGFWQIVVREAVGKWLSTLPLFLGYFMAIGRSRLALHDRLAKTKVVNKRVKE